MKRARALQHVAATAADLLVDLIREVGEKNNNHCHLGLGGGWTTRLVASQLATRLREAGDLPDLTIHAMTSGFDPLRPSTAPVTFFGFFEGIATKINYVGLFAQPFVKTELYDESIEAPGVKESFDRRDEINLVMTSLGSASHGNHGDFNRFMSRGKKKDVNMLNKADWKGDVQYQAFSSTAPIEKTTDIKAVTLLDLDRLSKFAADPNKHVVVVAGPCKECLQTRADAARPLLEAKKLKVWSHILFDLNTAEELLEAV